MTSMKNDIPKHGLEAFYRYYYSEEGKLTKRNDQPLKRRRGVKFGNPKIGYQEGPLKDYLFSGSFNQAQLLNNFQIGTTYKNPKEQSSQDNFLETLQRIDKSHNNSVSIEKGATLLENKLEVRKLTAVLLTSQNVERISKRLNLLKAKNMKFKFENSANVNFPNKVRFSSMSKIYRQLHKFLEKASEQLKQRTTLKHAYLLDGTPVFSLLDIPDDCKTIFLSHSPFFSKMINESVKSFNKTKFDKNRSQSYRNSQGVSSRIISPARKSMADIPSMKYVKYMEEAKEIRNKVSQDLQMVPLRNSIFKSPPPEVINELKKLLKGKVNLNRYDFTVKKREKLILEASPQKRLILNDSGGRIRVDDQTSQMGDKTAKISHFRINSDLEIANSHNFEISPQEKHEWFPTKRIKGSGFVPRHRRQRTEVIPIQKTARYRYDRLQKSSSKVLKGDFEWKNSKILKLLSSSNLDRSSDADSSSRFDP